MSNVEVQWVKEVKHFCKNVPFILVANKIDLRNDPEVIQSLKVMQKETISTDKTQSVAKKIHAYGCIECSAKTGENIDKVFDMAGRAAISHKKDKDKKHCILM